MNDSEPDSPLVQHSEPNALRVASEALRHGFTIIPNYILRSPNLSRDAKLLYGILLSYAWQKGSCFPGYETLQKDMGCGSAQISRYIKELKDTGWLHVVRRGQGKTNIYTLQDPTSNPGNPQFFQNERTGSSKPEDGAPQFFQNERTGSSKMKGPVLLKTKEEEYSVKKTQMKNTKISNLRRFERASEDQKGDVDNSAVPVDSCQGEENGTEKVEDPSVGDQARQVIVDYLEDFGREFHDQATLKSSVSRAYNLYRKAGVGIDTFVQAMYEARARTKEMTHAIRSGGGGNGFPVKYRMAYFFACLEEILGLKQHPGKR
jgi:hypothetical protein